MKENISDALTQYRLIRAEKDLLEETLNGALRAMTSILAASKPLFFGRSQRVKEIAFALAGELEVAEPWRLELAATVSYLGYVGLPDEVQEDVYHHKVLSDEVQDILKGVFFTFRPHGKCSFLLHQAPVTIALGCLNCFLVTDWISHLTGPLFRC
tara:strand:- start:9998 stop:10462 length:465 start_codon:yes stop_codon:yes gene_type:complete